MAGKAGTVVIGGGTGFVGGAIKRLLEYYKYEVVVISRMPGLRHMTWGDLHKHGLPDCDAVINVAGQNVLNPMRRWTPGFKQNVWASRVNTTKALVQAVRKSSSPPKVFASISGVGYYEPSPTKEYDESSPGGNFDFLSELCRDWEKASEFPDDFYIRRVVIRSGVVLGRPGGMIKQLYWPFFFGLGGPVGNGSQYMPWIHLEDLAFLFLHSIENNHVSGTLNGVAPEIVTNLQFAKTFAKAMWRPAVIPLPLWFVNLAFGEERAKIMTEGQKVIPKRTLESGFKFIHPNLNSACKDCARLFYTDVFF